VHGFKKPKLPVLQKQDLKLARRNQDLDDHVRLAVDFKLNGSSLGSNILSYDYKRLPPLSGRHPPLVPILLPVGRTLNSTDVIYFHVS
jgi:hypothetical protein